MSEEEMKEVQATAEEIKQRELKKTPQEAYNEFGVQHPVAARRVGIAIKVAKYGACVVGGWLLKMGFDMLSDKFSGGSSTTSYSETSSEE